MRVGDWEVEFQGDVVEVMGPTGLVAKGRWSDGKIVERKGVLGSPAVDADKWRELETGLRLDADAYLSAALAAAYDERGVDVTQIDRMLSLSPRERLEALDALRNSILSMIGNASRN